MRIEAPCVEPVFPEKNQAINYAQNRAFRLLRQIEHYNLKAIVADFAAASRRAFGADEKLSALVEFESAVRAAAN